MGLAVLPNVDAIISERKRVVELYNKLLDFSDLKKLVIREETTWNYSYYLVIFENEKQLLKIEKVLNKNNIFPRRYFYPSLTTLNYVSEKKCPISEDISKRILCLPLYIGLKDEVIKTIVNLIY